MSASIASNLETSQPDGDTAMVLSWCLSIGLETIMDIAGTQESELLALCPDYLKTKIQPIHQWACSIKQDSFQSRETVRLSSLLPDRYVFVPPEHKSRLRGNPKAPGNDETSTEREKSLQVARSLLTMMAVKATISPLAVEWESSRLKSEAHGRAWQEAMAGAIADSASLASLRSALGEWQRLTCFLANNHPPVHRAEDMQALDLYRFLKARTDQGPTAAAGAWRSLSWVQANLKVDMHTENILVKQFSTAKGHEQSQAVVIPIHIIRLMFGYAELLPTDSKKADPMVVACALVLRVMILGIRFEHATRASRLPEECDGRKDVWLFSKGKDGQPFKLPLPTHTRADMPLMATLQNFLKAQLGAMADSILVPDMALPHGGLDRCGSEAQILPQRMKYGRFNKLIRDVVYFLAAGDESVAAKMSSYSLRRALPSIADAAGLSEFQRNSLGNWRDGCKLKEPLAVRYSSARLDSSNLTKQMCLAIAAAASEGDIDTASSDASKIMGVRNRKDAIEASILTDSWGKLEGSGRPVQSAPSPEGLSPTLSLPDSVDPGSSKRPALLEVQPLQPAKKPRTSIGSSDSSGGTACPAAEEPLEEYSDTCSETGDEDASGSESNEDTAALRNQEIADFDVYWVAPTRGLIHVSSDLDDITPICSSRAFTTEVETGKGFYSASLLSRTWCPRCLARRPDLAAEVVRDATYLMKAL